MFTDNAADNGGAVYSDGTLTVTDSAFRGDNSSRDASALNDNQANALLTRQYRKGFEVPAQA